MSDSGDSEPTQTNRAYSKKQWLMFTLLVAFGGLLVLAVVTKAPHHSARPSAKKATFKAATAELSPHDAWLMNTEEAVSTLKKEMASLLTTKREDTMAMQQERLSHQQRMSELTARLNRLEAENNQLRQLPAEQDMERADIVPPPRLQSVFIAPKKTRVPKTPETYVPSGSVVNAVLLSGVYASVGVNSSADPRPVLMRLISRGSLPNGAFSHLKDCRLTGAAFGDISCRSDSAACIIIFHGL